MLKPPHPFFVVVFLNIFVDHNQIQKQTAASPMHLVAGRSDPRRAAQPFQCSCCTSRVALWRSVIGSSSSVLWHNVHVVQSRSEKRNYHYPKNRGRSFYTYLIRSVGGKHHFCVCIEPIMREREKDACPRVYVYATFQRKVSCSDPDLLI